MTCTRTWPLIGLLGLSLACTRDNPAFDDEAGGGDLETSSESDSTTMADETSTDEASTDEASTDATDDASSIDASSDDSTTDPVTDLPAEACENQLRPGLSLGFGDPFHLGGQCPLTVAMSGVLTFDPNLQSLVINRCDGGDVLCQGECGFEKHPVVVDFDIGTFIGSCVSFQAFEPIANGGDVCNWGSISMFPNGNTSAPLAVAVTAGIEPTTIAKTALGGYPQLMQTATCQCEDYSIAESCCTDSFGVLFFDFVLPGGTTVTPGETADIELGMSPYPYKFVGEQAQRIGDCGTTAAIDLSWYMLAQF